MLQLDSSPQSGTVCGLGLGRWETGDASTGRPCYELVMGRQGLPPDKAVPACLQAGVW